MSDKPRSIIMPNEPENVTIVSPDKAIITPGEAKERIEKKSKARFAGPNRYAISRDEAVSIAVQIGQEVYDQLRAEHALAMGALSTDLAKHFREIRNVTAANILDLQRRSFSYRIRRDFDVDLQRMAAKLRDWWQMVLAWLELHGFREAPEELEADRGGMYKNYFKVDPSVPPDELHVRDAEGNTTKIVNLRNASDDEVEPENVGAPSELPESPEVARVITLSSQD